MAIGHSPMLRAAATTHPSIGARLNLFNEFELLVDGRHVSVPHGVQRLLAVLGLAARPVGRSRLAGQLWPDVSEARALGNLRSALWRLRHIRQPIVSSIDDRLVLAAGVQVDVAEVARLLTALTHHPDAEALSRLPELLDAAELLPGCEDEWVIVERERYRELRLHALELASASLLESGEFADAVEAAMAAVDAEPFRDSAHRLLVQIHLREGNVAAALRSFGSYRDLMLRELGIEPSQRMLQLVAGIPGASTAL